MTASTHVERAPATRLTAQVDARVARPRLGTARIGPLVLLHTGRRAASVFCVVAALLFGAWVLVPTLVLGWEATAIESGSMEPTVTRGDVVLLRPVSAEPVSVGSVVRFRAPGSVGTTVHRVVKVDRARRTYVTRGDANPGADPDPVPFDAVDGVGTVLVPMVGFPVLWARDGATLPLVLLSGGLLVLLLPGLDAVAGVASRRRRHRPLVGQLAPPSGGAR